MNPSGDHSDAKLGPGRGIDQLRGLAREAIRPDGLRRLLGCLARCVAGHAVLLEADGRLSYSSPEMGHDLLEAVDEEVERVRTGRAHSTTAERDTKVIVVMAIANRTSGPVLVVVGGRPEVARHKELIADTARLLWLCWQVETSNRTMQRLEKADTQVREVVLHLLMLGQYGGARRVAATMGPRLADPIRVYLAECERRPGARDALVAQCTDACGARAWVVRCPVYPRHVIVLAPVERATNQAPEAFDDRQIRADRIEEGFRAFVLDHRDVHVGASQVISLRETAAGYEQAFHALAAAKAGKKGYARFSPYDELATLLGEPGRAWSREVLAPLLNHVPVRPQDPDAETLKVTLDSWLSFHHGAVRLLKIHRNTLSARLRRIECLLDCDLRQVRTQATVHLALRIQHGPRFPERGDREDSIEGMLDTDAARRWAQRRLAPLLTDDAAPLLTTLQTWLANNARLDAAAAVLGISVPGVRKRLLRLGGILERSVLDGPSAQYDLWLALRIHHGQGL